jgi:hypothetical protein
LNLPWVVILVMVLRTHSNIASIDIAILEHPRDF